LSVNQLNASSFISSIDAGKSPECPDKPAGADQWGVLKVSAISPEGLKSFENKVLEKNEFHNLAFIIKNGDLLISRANTPELVEMICYVDEVRTNLLLSDKTLRIHTDKNKIDKRFLYWAFQYSRTRKQVEVRATGSSGSMKNISQQDIRNLLLSMPKKLEEQYQIKRNSSRG
jgi:type I restriction enzyme, S subunit